MDTSDRRIRPSYNDHINNMAKKLLTYLCGTFENRILLYILEVYTRDTCRMKNKAISTIGKCRCKNTVQII